MHLICIADPHLGLAAFNRLDPESGMNLREKQVFDNFLKAIEVIIKQKPDVLVHDGDLFDVVKTKTRTHKPAFNQEHSWCLTLFYPPLPNGHL